MEYGLDATPRIEEKKPPGCCAWCGNLMANIRNIFKGQNCERHYCCLEHLVRGEERAVIYKRAGELL